MPLIHCSALLIDMDGVLVDSTAAIARVWARWTDRFHLDADRVTALAHGRTSLATIQDLFPNESPEFHRREFDWTVREEIADIADVVALPGARALLASVPPEQRAVVTSASRDLAEVRLRAAGVWDLVSQLVTASDIQNGKPHPEPYLKGAAALGFPPRDCLVIEDAASGTRAGKAAGARVLAIRTTSDDASLLAAGADWLANDCASLHCSVSPDTRQIAMEFSDNEIPRLPKMR
jgi:mannitol-1-/sugar-/sorbitol-6-phosphatase